MGGGGGGGEMSTVGGWARKRESGCRDVREDVTHRMLPAGCVTTDDRRSCMYMVHSWWSSRQRLTACWSLGTSPLADTSSADVWPLAHVRR